MRAHRRDVERAARSGRGEHVVAQDARKLGLPVGLAPAERRALEPRPDAAAVGRDDQQPALAGKHAPGLAQQVALTLAALQAVDQEHPVDRGIGQRQLPTVMSVV